jgi:hypothetical protein
MIKAGEELLRLQAENIRLKEGIKQAREEMESRLYKGIPETTGFTWQNLGINMCLAILDKLIEESE